MFYFNSYAIPPFIASLLIISLGIFVWYKNLKSSVNFSWFLVCFSVYIWLVGDTLLFSTHNKRMGIFFTQFVYVGVTAVPICNLYFSAALSKIKIKRLYVLVAALFYITAIIIIWNSKWIIGGEVYNFYWGFYPKAQKYHWIYLLIWAAIFALGPIVIRIRINKPFISNTEKNRLLYTFFALVFGGVIGPLDFIQKYGIEFYPVGYFAVPAIIVFITYAILKYNLLDINIIIKRSIVYSIFVAILTAIYLLLIIFSEWLLRGIVGYKSFILSLSLAFIMALIFNPLRIRIQNIIDRIFLGKLPYEITEENDRLRQELERSERLKVASTLALGLAHEIKNPLTTLKTFSEYLPQKLDDKGFLEKFSKLIPEEVERINSIVHQLLDFSKPAPPSFKDVPIHNIIHGILELLSNDFLKRKVVINESFDDLNLLIKVDSVQLKQALLNIILNAMDSMPNGGNIFIKTIRQNNYFEIEIADGGCGIAEKDLKHIFDPFFSTKESGTGLGLSISHQIIKNHKGTIEVDSQINKGTTFRIRLPLT
jgi:signal transduction histidine kinase